MDFEEFPKVLYHPNATPAVNQGAPATFPPVTVESPDQEAEYLAKGYQTTPQDAQAFVRSVLATKPPGYEFVEYPKWKYHATKEARIVADATADKSFGKGWQDTPVVPAEE